jgi:hypothetical protein
MSLSGLPSLTSNGRVEDPGMTQVDSERSG